MFTHSLFLEFRLVQEMSQKETYESQTETLLICGESNSSSNPICPKMDPAMIQRSLWADWCQFVHRDDPYLSECAEVWNQEKWWQVGTALFLTYSEIPSHSDGRSPVHHVVSFNSCMMCLQGGCKDGCTASNCPIVSCIGPVLIYTIFSLALCILRCKVQCGSTWHESLDWDL